MSNETVAVVGLGLLGRGIAACFVGRGFDVIGYEPTRETLDAARPQVERMTAEVRDLLPSPLPQGRGVGGEGGRFIPTTDLRSLAGCELVIESVVEDAAVKRSVLDQIERVVTPEALVATNTSAIPITELQRPMRHPRRFIGMHFAGPAHVTRFLEIIRGDLTADETCQRVERIARRVGKEPCLCQKDVPGFIVNRIAYAMYREAFHLLEAGAADAETIDRAVRDTLSLWAAVCGPFRWIDISGGPELYARAMKRVLPTLCNDADVSPTLQRLLDEGARGTTNGHGVFDYGPDDQERWAKLWHDNALRTSRLLDELFPLQQGDRP